MHEISQVLPFILPFGLVLSVAIIIMGGFLYVSSGGDPARMEQAKVYILTGGFNIVVVMTVMVIHTILNAEEATRTTQTMNQVNEVIGWGIIAGLAAGVVYGIMKFLLLYKQARKTNQVEVVEISETQKQPETQETIMQELDRTLTIIQRKYLH